MEPTAPDENGGFANKENLARLDSGVVLVARDILHDPNFAATVVLICIYAKDGGAYGLVLNRPSHMPLSEIFDGFTDSSSNRTVFIGGPVEQDELQILQITDTPVPEAHRIAPRVYLGGKWEDVDQMIQSTEDSTCLFLGYSGWGADQVENEILAGAWDVMEVDLELLLRNIDRVLVPDVKSIAEYLDSIRR